MPEEELALFKWVIGGMGTGIVGMAAFIVYQVKTAAERQEKHAQTIQEITDEYAEKLHNLVVESIKSQNDNAVALENNTRVMEKILDRKR